MSILKIFYLTIAMMVSVAASQADAADLKGASVRIRLLDKITGRSHVKEIKVGETEIFEELRITPLSCFAKPPEDTPENAAYFEIELHAKSADPKMIFKGWMFSSSPAISALEHPVYDVWVLSCTNILPREEDEQPQEEPEVTIQRKEEVILLDEIETMDVPQSSEGAEQALPPPEDPALHGIEIIQ